MTLFNVFQKLQLLYHLFITLNMTVLIKDFLPPFCDFAECAFKMKAFRTWKEMEGGGDVNTCKYTHIKLKN